MRQWQSREPCHQREATTTTLTAVPNPATAGSSVTLTAMVTDADKTVPAGSVQFEVGGRHAIGMPIALTASGVATTTTTFATAGTAALSAVFTPSNFAFAPSTGTLSLVVNASGGQGGSGRQTAGTAPVSVTLPPTGALTVTIAPGTVNLVESASSGMLVATGVLNDITVADTRNYLPGFSVLVQESMFTGSGSAAGFTMSGDDLGWVPIAVSTLTGGVTLGPTVAPGTSPGGLGDTGAVLAEALPGSGYGTSTFSANLTLDIPEAARPGPYAGSLTITYIDAGP